MKPITKSHNTFDILTYSILALVATTIGMTYNAPIIYLAAAVILTLALFRRYWLHKRLDRGIKD
ncbi:MAG TPA: hypothetical protein VFF28_04000 [Candidatus Nanoarchaeia archaeon]|nr:hypothetical protein [Candidatus Nanoarchaeia archaeon]